MAVAFGAATEHVATSSTMTHAHTPAGTPRWVAVLVAHGGIANDIVSGVTYGGVALTPRIRTESDTAGQVGRVYLYFRGAGVPTGVQNCVVSRIQSTATVQVTCVTGPAAGDVEVVDHDGVSEDAANPQVTLSYGGRVGLALGVLYSGRNLLSDVTPLSGMTLLFPEDLTNRQARSDRQTTPGSANFTFGYTAATDDCAMAAMVISEIVTDRTGDIAIAFTLKVAATALNDVPPLIWASRPVHEVERVELWSDVEANDGRLIGVVAQLLGLSERVRHGGEHTLSLEVALDHPIIRRPGMAVGTINLRHNQVLRLLKTGGTWSEHRISETTRQRQGGRWTRAVLARSIDQDLGTRGLVQRTTADGATTADFQVLGLHPQLHLEHFVLTALEQAGQPFWRIGTLELDGTDPDNPPIDLVYAQDSPRSAILKIAAAIGGRDLVVRGTSTAYFLDLLRRAGSTLAPIIVRARRNLVDMGLTERDDDQATRVAAFGAAVDGVRPSLGLAEWDVIGVTVVNASLIDITLADPAGGPGPIAFDDQFVPPVLPDPGPDEEAAEAAARFHLRYTSAGDFSAPIVATFAATQVVRVESAGPASGPTFIGLARARIVADTLGSENLSVDHPAMVADYGVREAVLNRDDIPATDNLIPNPLGRIWPAASPLPTGWVIRDLNPQDPATVTVTRETSVRYWEHGGQAVRARFPVGSGDILAVGFPPVRLPHRAHGYLSFFVRVTTLVGRIQVWLQVTRRSTDLDGNPAAPLPYLGLPGDPYQYRIPFESGSFLNDVVLPHVDSVQLNTPEDLGIAAAWDLSRYPLYGGTAELFVMPASEGGSAIDAAVECIIEAGQLTVSAQQMPLLEGNGGVRLHQAANARVGIYGTPAPVVSVNMLDLAVADGLRFPFAPLQINVPLQVDDPDPASPPVLTRVLGWTRDWHRRLMPSLDLSNERPDITAVLAARGTGTRHPTTLVPGGTRGIDNG